MGKYDGPSFYKKDHPKVAAIKENQFRNGYKKSLSKNVRTRDAIKKDAENYMETPSVNAPPEKYTFRRKYIPASLQNLEGWQETKKNDKLIGEIQKRLAKEEESYLLFGDALKEKPKKQAAPEQPEESTKQAALEKPKSAQKKKVRKKRPKKVKHQTKANIGLHRSLSNIIAEDQEAIKNGRNNLDSLFSEDK